MTFFNIYERTPNGGCGKFWGRVSHFDAPYFRGQPDRFVVIPAGGLPDFSDF